MINRSRSLKRLVSAFGLTLAASLSVVALSAGSASALQFEPQESLPTAMTWGFGSVSVTSSGTGGIYCSSGSGSGKFATGTSGSLILEMSGCVAPNQPTPLEPKGASCTTEGRSKGTIGSKVLSVQPVYLDAAKTRFGLLVRGENAGPNWWETGTVAAFKCNSSSTARSLNGSFIVEITSPGLNQSSKTFTLLSNGWNQVEGSTVYDLYDNGYGKAKLSTSGSLNLNLQSGRFIP